GRGKGGGRPVADVRGHSGVLASLTVEDVEPAPGQESMDKPSTDGRCCYTSVQEKLNVGRRAARCADAGGLRGQERRGVARGLPQAAPASGWRGATAGIVPGARLVEFGIVLVRPDRAGRRRVLDDECLCPARLRRLDDGPREL